MLLWELLSVELVPGPELARELVIELVRELLRLEVDSEWVLVCVLVRDVDSDLVLVLDVVSELLSVRELVCDVDSGLVLV